MRNDMSIDVCNVNDDMSAIDSIFRYPNCFLLFVRFKVYCFSIISVFLFRARSFKTYIFVSINMERHLFRSSCINKCVCRISKKSLILLFIEYHIKDNMTSIKNRLLRNVKNMIATINHPYSFVPASQGVENNVKATLCFILTAFHILYHSYLQGMKKLFIGQKFVNVLKFLQNGIRRTSTSRSATSTNDDNGFVINDLFYQFI